MHGVQGGINIMKDLQKKKHATSTHQRKVMSVLMHLDTHCKLIYLAIPIINF